MELKAEFNSYSLFDSLWAGAKENAEKLLSAGLWDRCYGLVEDMADGVMSLTDVNDMLWFEFGYLLESMGCKEDDDGTIRRIEDE